MTSNAPTDSIKTYYGQTLQTSADLKTSACCTLTDIPKYVRALLADVHPTVKERFYGCGSPLPPALGGCTVLDLGCGSGRDCFLLSRLVGEHGQVIGVDMTAAQLAVANAHLDWHQQRYGYARSNIEFMLGQIENLAALNIADNAIDVVVSNCAINLSMHKAQVLAEIFRVLKPGGELYFSDIYADRRIPDTLKHDPILLGECLAGAWYWEDFRCVLHTLGCPDIRIVSETPIALNDDEVAEKIGMVQFRSVTVRAFKLPLEDRCEDYGQIAVYQGGIADHTHAFTLDDHHTFETGKPLRVCGNTADMLALSRYAPYFTLIGDKATHFGLFDCSPPNTSGMPSKTVTACC